jgi:hypothetical protein
VALQPALTRATGIATVAFNKQLERVVQMTTESMASTAKSTDSSLMMESQLVVNEADVMRFLRNAKHAGMRPRVAFAEAMDPDSGNTNSNNSGGGLPHARRDANQAGLSAVPIGAFERGMVALGWRRSLSSLRAFVWDWQLQHGGVVDISQALELSRRFAQVHDDLAFASDSCGSQVALSSDGASASALGSPNGGGSAHFVPTVGLRVLVRHKGGGSFYPAQVLQAEKNGFFRVGFENFSEREASVPVEWLRPAQAVSTPDDKLHRDVQPEASQGVAMDGVLEVNNLAIASSRFTAGVHAW